MEVTTRLHLPLLPGCWGEAPPAKVRSYRAVAVCVFQGNCAYITPPTISLSAGRSLLQIWHNRHICESHTLGRSHFARGTSCHPNPLRENLTDVIFPGKNHQFCLSIHCNLLSTSSPDRDRIYLCKHPVGLASVGMACCPQWNSRNGSPMQEWILHKCFHQVQFMFLGVSHLR